MGLLGQNDLKQFLIPTGIDAGELTKYALADGTTYDQLITDIAAGLSMANSEMFSDPRYGGLMSLTTELATEIRNGGGNGFRERTENQSADPQRAATIGSMLPLRSYDRGMGWTWDFLRKARQSQIDADIAAVVYDAKDNFEKRLLERLFSNTYNTLATAGIDAPFVDGTTVSLNYTPPPYGGTTFTNTHTHFARLTDDATGRIAAMNNGARTLAEHGIPGPYTAIIPQADLAAWKALGSGANVWVNPSWDLNVQYLQTSSTNIPAAVASINAEIYVGVFISNDGPVWVWASSRVPTDYFAMYKTYGPMDTRNPLAVRYSEDLGAGVLLMAGEGFRKFPLEKADAIHEFGVGVRDRLAAYLVYFAGSGDYTAPTIS